MADRRFFVRSCLRENVLSHRLLRTCRTDHAPAGEYGRRDSEEDFAGLKEALGGDGYRNLANVKRLLDYKGRILWARERGKWRSGTT